jgi:hypothetical protein
MSELNELTEALLSSTTVDLSGTGQTTLFTVPSGKRCVVTKAVLIAGADCGASVITIGQSGALTDFLGSQNLGNIDAQYDVAILQPIPNATPVLNKSYAEATNIQVDVSTALGGATNTMLLFGILY